MGCYIVIFQVAWVVSAYCAQAYPGELKKLRPSILWNCLVMLSLCHNKPYKLESPLPKITGCSHLHQYDFLNNLLAETGTNTPQEAMTALQITASTCPTQYPKPMIFGPVRETGQGSSHIVARPISESYLSIALKMLGINDASIRSLRRVISMQRQTLHTR